MSKTREALERAERERIARKEQQPVPIKKPAAKKSVYVILATFGIMIFGLFCYWAGSTGYLNRITDVAKKNPGSIAAKDPSANVQSQVITSEEIFGVQIFDFYEDTIQQLEVLSRSEQSAIPIPQKLNNTNRTKDPQSDVVSDQLLDTANSTDVSLKSADRHPDPASWDQNGPAHQSRHSLKTSDALISPGLTADSKSSGQNSIAPVISETPPAEEKDKSPDPGNLIDWVLEKRSIKNE